MRRDRTPAEEELWHKLRNRRLAGYKFLNQHTIAGFIVDFVCHEAKLIVEVDGYSHSEAKDYDAARTRKLEEKGFTVLRVGNWSTYHTMESVLEVILAEICRKTGRNYSEFG